MLEFTEKEKALLKCAFETETMDCKSCPLSQDGCSSPEEGDGFNKLGQDLLRRHGLI